MERLSTACLLIGATSTFARYRSSKPVGPLWPAQEEPLHRHRSALANKVHVFFRWSSSLRWRAPRLISCPGLSGGAKLGARARALCHQTIVPARQRTRVDVKKTASPAEIEITQTALI